MGAGGEMVVHVEGAALAAPRRHSAPDRWEIGPTFTVPPFGPALPLTICPSMHI